MTGLIDSHCHLTHENIIPLGDVRTIMDRARTAGVGGALTICCEITREFDTLLSVARENPDVWCTVGTHPHESAIPSEMALITQDIVDRANSDPRVIGIGETGLDYYYDHSDRAIQAASFRKHIRAAIQTNLPLIIHARDADQDLIQILKEEGAGTNPHVRGVMHCFSGTRWLMEQALDIGFYISLSGILTFKKAAELRDIVADVPLDRLLIETDAPYLAPEPYRGKVNEPALMVHTLKVLADIKKQDKENMINICNNNFFSLFTRAKMPG